LGGLRNDRVGIVVFSGEAILLGPPTLDYSASQKLVEPIETGTLTGGTAIGTGLATGINVLRDSQAKSKVVILLTDGENNGGDITPLDAAAGTGARLASASPARQVTKLILVGAGCLLVVVALVGPEIGEAPRRAPISTLDTIVALDISQSMAVRDVETDRLHVAQRAI